MINILNIVKSRFIDGEKLPEWYEQRLQICSVCPLNSKNIEQKDKSVARKGRGILFIKSTTVYKVGDTLILKPSK